MDDDILAMPDVMDLLQKNDGIVEKHLDICNMDRSVGGRISGAIARKHGNYGFAGKLNLNFTGSAGQSFGVWNIQGVNLRVVGECNDYVAKGMAGGTLIVLPPSASTFKSEDNVIAGNTCLYGATGGEVFLSGRAGERFGVRNAGCQAVIEGSGDHLGEYMTNGVIVALSKIGRNVGAGMSGGLIYVYDRDDEGVKMNKMNEKNVFRVTTEAGKQQLKGLVEKHQKHTGSSVATAILQDWDSAVTKFWQVAPLSTHSTDFVSASSGVAAPAAGGVAVAAKVTAVAAEKPPRSSSPPSNRSQMLGGSNP
mmetsp:Transcript_82332/g.265468  ORF Transcript_82332/g.265468 Transcript_82332/m.265468 type:complete len:308 (-) Transcript_82332:64-987(-)